jgi:hypothetical protein
MRIMLLAAALLTVAGCANGGGYGGANAARIGDGPTRKECASLVAQGGLKLPSDPDAYARAAGCP